jgi:hypothetical protein
MTLLYKVFWAMIISKGIWPPWLLELTSPDYHLWGGGGGQLKAQFKKKNQKNIEIRNRIANSS